MKIIWVIERRKNSTLKEEWVICWEKPFHLTKVAAEKRIELINIVWPTVKYRVCPYGSIEDMNDERKE